MPRANSGPVGVASGRRVRSKQADHGRHRAHQSAVRGLVLGPRARPAAARQEGQHAAACLPLLAALTPAEHRVTLVDENVEPIDFDRLAQADIVGLTGMSVQRRRMREILAELKRRGVFTVVGGPWVSVQEDYFGDLVDVIFVGEAEETWPQFLDEWARRRHSAATSRPRRPT